MAIKVFKPTSPGRRFMTGYAFDEITKAKPEKSLVVPLKKKAGRNNQGRITVRHRGGGAKRMLRIIDFKRDKIGVPGEVVSIEYDPNRTARIALIRYEDGEKRYILAPVGLREGATIVAGSGAELSPGNALPLAEIPSGTSVHALELQPGRGARIVRGAGTSAQVLGREGQYTMVRLPSGEMRRVPSICKATIGQVGNLEHQNITLGKAGRNRWLGRRPKVRGSAMSPRDHPHGGGEGRTGQGMNPKTPKGRPALGPKTRKRAKASDKFIVKRRK